MNTWLFHETVHFLPSASAQTTTFSSYSKYLICRSQRP